jgi:hypothetical protein
MLDQYVDNVANYLINLEKVEVDLDKSINDIIPEAIDEFTQVSSENKTEQTKIIVKLITYLVDSNEVVIGKGYLRFSVRVLRCSADLNLISNKSNDSVRVSIIGGDLDLDFSTSFSDKQLSFITIVSERLGVNVGYGLSTNQEKAANRVDRGENFLILYNDNRSSLETNLEGFQIVGKQTTTIFCQFGPFLCLRNNVDIKEAIVDMLHDALSMFNDELYIDVDKFNNFPRKLSEEDVDRLVVTARCLNQLDFTTLQPSFKLDQAYAVYSIELEEGYSWKSKKKIQAIKPELITSISLRTVVNSRIIKYTKKPTISGFIKASKTSILHKTYAFALFISVENLPSVLACLPDSVEVMEYDPSSTPKTSYTSSKNAGCVEVTNLGVLEDQNFKEVKESVKLSDVLSAYSNYKVYYIGYSRLTKHVSPYLASSSNFVSCALQPINALKSDSIVLLGVTEAGKKACEALNIKHIDVWLADTLGTLTKQDKEFIRFSLANRGDYTKFVDQTNFSELKLLSLFKNYSTKLSKFNQGYTVLINILSKQKIIISNDEFYKLTKDQEIFDFGLVSYNSFNKLTPVSRVCEVFYRSVLKLFTNNDTDFKSHNYIIAANLVKHFVEGELVDNCTLKDYIEAKLKTASPEDAKKLQFFKFVVDASNLEANLDKLIEEAGAKNLSKFRFKYVSLPLYLAAFNSDKLSERHLDIVLDSATNLDLLLISSFTGSEKALETYERKQFDFIIGGL